MSERTTASLLDELVHLAIETEGAYDREMREVREQSEVLRTTKAPSMPEMRNDDAYKKGFIAGIEAAAAEADWCSEVKTMNESTAMHIAKRIRQLCLTTKRDMK